MRVEDISIRKMIDPGKALEPVVNARNKRAMLKMPDNLRVFLAE
jgi:hypothetical protein